MLISEQKRFIFIAVPKTGTTSIEEHLRKLDPSVRRNEVPLGGGSWQQVHKHARATQIRELMGERMDDFTVIAFLREPVTTVISKYYYYKIGRGAERAKVEPFTKRGILNRLKTLSAKILPIRLWALLYPFSMTHQFVLGNDGELLVDEIGDFSTLQKDFNAIFGRLGFDEKELALPMTNKSKYASNRHEDDALLRRIVRWKSRIDVGIFENHSVSANAASKPSVSAD